MICSLCSNSMIQEYVNGDDKTEVVWCLKVHTRMVGRINKCSGFEKGYESFSKTTTKNIDNVTQQKCNTQMLNFTDEQLVELNVVDKDAKLSQSDRMKEYWRKKKEK